MNIVLTVFASLALAGIIISPFFWLKFLKKKSVVKYLVASSISVVVIFGWYLFFGYDLINDWSAGVEPGVYYFFYDVLQYTIYVVLFFVIVSPFIFAGILGKIFDLKFFFTLLLCSVVIFVSMFLFWVYVLLPKAFGDLLRHL